MNIHVQTHVEDIELLQAFYSEGRYDEIHAMMTGSSDNRLQITPEMRTWYGRLLETLGEVKAADQQYVLAGADGATDKVRNLLRMGCAVSDAIVQVLQSGSPKAAAFLARFLESSYPPEDTLQRSIVRLYCLGNCVDYAVLYSINQGEASIAEFLSVMESELLSPPMKKVQLILSHLDENKEYRDKIRLLAATCDGTILAAQECITRNMPEALHDLVRHDRFRRAVIALTNNNCLRNDIIGMVRNLNEPQLLFNFLVDCGMLCDTELYHLYVTYITLRLSYIDLIHSSQTFTSMIHSSTQSRTRPSRRGW
jgi:hypothetical protein